MPYEPYVTPSGGYRVPRQPELFVTICSKPSVRLIARVIFPFAYCIEDKMAPAAAWIVSVFRSRRGMIFPVMPRPQRMYRITCPSHAPVGWPPSV